MEERAANTVVFARGRPQVDVAKAVPAKHRNHPVQMYHQHNHYARIDAAAKDCNVQARGKTVCGFKHP